MTDGISVKASFHLVDPYAIRRGFRTIVGRTIDAVRLCGAPSGNVGGRLGDAIAMWNFRSEQLTAALYRIVPLKQTGQYVVSHSQGR